MTHTSYLHTDRQERLSALCKGQANEQEVNRKIKPLCRYKQQKIKLIITSNLINYSATANVRSRQNKTNISGQTYTPFIPTLIKVNEIHKRLVGVLK